MLRIGTVTLSVEEGSLLGRSHTLDNHPSVSRRHVRWQHVFPSYARGLVLCPNGVLHRPHNQTRWVLVGKGEHFTLRDGGQVCLRPLHRRRRVTEAKPVLRKDLDPLSLFTFVGDYDSDETIDE
tara:strand:+ start:96 stop:467 length:372 start_codon:yes stop_codon:yes gene_type:complete